MMHLFLKLYFVIIWIFGTLRNFTGLKKGEKNIIERQDVTQGKLVLGYDVLVDTKEDLYKTYNTFYQPSNMFLVISGNFNKEEALEVIKNNEYLNKAVTNKEIIEEKIEEPLEVNEKFAETKMNTQSTKVNYSIKVPIKDYKGLEIIHVLSSKKEEVRIIL